MRSAEGGEPPRELSRRAAACLWCRRLHLGEHSCYIWASTAIAFGRAQLLHLGEHSYYIWASTAASAGAQELRTEEQGERGASWLSCY